MTGVIEFSPSYTKFVYGIREAELLSISVKYHITYETEQIDLVGITPEGVLGTVTLFGKFQYQGIEDYLNSEDLNALETTSQNFKNLVAAVVDKFKNSFEFIYVPNAGYMLTATYDSNEDGVVSAASELRNDTYRVKFIDGAWQLLVDSNTFLKVGTDTHLKASNFTIEASNVIIDASTLKLPFTSSGDLFERIAVDENGYLIQGSLPKPEPKSMVSNQVDLGNPLGYYYDDVFEYNNLRVINPVDGGKAVLKWSTPSSPLASNRITLVNDFSSWSSSEPNLVEVTIFGEILYYRFLGVLSNYTNSFLPKIDYWWRTKDLGYPNQDIDYIADSLLGLLLSGSDIEYYSPDGMLLFDKTQQNALTTELYETPQSVFTVSMVLKIASTVGSNEAVWSNNSGIIGSAGTIALVGVGSNAVLEVNVGGVTGANATLSLNSYRTVTVVVDGANSKLYVDTNLIETRNYPATLSNFIVGAGFGLSGSAIGSSNIKVGDIIVASQALEASDIANIVSHMQTKYGY